MKFQKAMYSKYGCKGGMYHKYGGKRLIFINNRVHPAVELNSTAS